MHLVPAQEAFGPFYISDETSYSGAVKWVTNRYAGSTDAAFSICGHRGTQVDCFVPEGKTDRWQYAEIRGGWNAMSSYAQRHQPTDCC